MKTQQRRRKQVLMHKGRKRKKQQKACNRSSSMGLNESKVSCLQKRKTHSRDEEKEEKQHSFLVIEFDYFE